MDSEMEGVYAAKALTSQTYLCLLIEKMFKPNPKNPLKIKRQVKTEIHKF